MYTYIKDNFDQMKITDKYNFIFFGFLLYQYNAKIVDIIETEFPLEIIQNKNVAELLTNYHKLTNEKNRKEDIITLCLHNLYIELYNIFKNKYDEIRNNNYSIFPNSISENDLLIINNEYYKYNEPQNKNFTSLYQLSNDIEKLINQVKNSKQKKENANDKDENKNKKILISNKFLLIGDKVTILDKESEKESIKENIEKDKNIKNDNIIITLPDISYDKKDISLQYLMMFYSRCTLGTRVFPTFIKNAVSSNNEDDIKIALNYITNLYYYFKTKPSKSEKDYSIISSKTNEYFEAFKVMIGKMKKANISFKSINELNSIEIDKSKMNTFISLEEDKSIELRPDKWNKKKQKDLQILQQFEDKLSRNINYAAGTASINRTINLNENIFMKNAQDIKNEIKKDNTNATTLDLGKDKGEKDKTDKLVTKVFVKKSELKDRKPKKVSDPKKRWDL